MDERTVEIWSDIACPWCWVGKRHLEAAIAAYGDPVRVVWRAFELDPNAPPSPGEEVDYAERLAKKYGCEPRQAQEMIDRITRAGAQDGLAFRFDRIKPGNTFDAHRLLHLAGERGVQNELKERLFRAYFEEGRAISRREVLQEVAADIGLDRAEIEAVLDGDAHANDVRAEEAESQRLGISGVPFFVIDRRYAVSGAQPTSLLLEALRKARADDAPHTETRGADACGTDGCEVPPR